MTVNKLLSMCWKNWRFSGFKLRFKVLNLDRRAFI